MCKTNNSSNLVIVLIYKRIQNSSQPTQSCNFLNNLAAKFTQICKILQGNQATRKIHHNLNLPPYTNCQVLTKKPWKNPPYLTSCSPEQRGDIQHNESSLNQRLGGKGWVDTVTFGCEKEGRRFRENNIPILFLGHFL